MVAPLLRSLLLLGTLASPASAQTLPAPGTTVVGAKVPTTRSVKPVGAEGAFVNQLDATFGRDRPDATVRSKAELDRIAYYRFIYGDATTRGAGVDGLYDNYRSRHRDYPDGDRRSLHVVTADGLTLKGHCGLETDDRSDCSEGRIESGIIRFALPVRPGSFIEIRCKMPTAIYAWPAFWLNPGQQFAPKPPGGKAVISELAWPPEIDIFDQFGFNNVPVGHYLVSGTPTAGKPAAFGNPHDTYRDPAWGNKWYYQPKQDLTDGYHTYGLDWTVDHKLRYLLDGKVYRESYFEWNSKGNVPAHLIASLQIAPKFNDLGRISDQGGVPNGWDWTIDYIRVWGRADDTPK